MSGTFGPTLRRMRVAGGLSLEAIARETKVSVELWEDLERNDCRRWPAGIYARGYIRAYARMVGLDPDETVNDFCREFTQGDRRAEPLLREHAEIVGHTLAWHDDLVHPDGERRASAPSLLSKLKALQKRHRRLTAAALDLALVLVVAAVLSAVVPVNGWMTFAVTAALYHSISLSLLGCTPAAWV